MQIKYTINYTIHIRLPQWLSSKESAYSAGAAGDLSSIPGSGSSLEKETATHSSTLA